MKHSKRLHVAGLGLVMGAMLLSGCARSTMMPVRALEADVRPYSSVKVLVESKVAEDVSKEISDLQGEILSKLRELNSFQEVTLADEAAPGDALVVKASVVGIKKVGGGARFFLGAFAGRAAMTTDVEYVDGATGKSLGTYGIREETGSSGYAGTTSESVKKTAKAITKFVADHFSTPTAAKR